MRSRAAIISVSTSRSARRDRDEGGLRLAAFAQRLDIEIVGQDLIPDQRALIEDRLRH